MGARVGAGVGFLSGTRMEALGETLVGTRMGALVRVWVVVRMEIWLGVLLVARVVAEKPHHPIKVATAHCDYAVEVVDVVAPQGSCLEV